MLICYKNDEECIVCTLEKEHEVIDEFFTKGGRFLEDYDREEFAQNYFTVVSRLLV